MSLAQPPIKDRFLAALRAIIQAEVPNVTFLGQYEYAIQAVSGSPPNVTLDCRPTDPALSLPPLVQVVMQPGIDGITTIPSVGMNCVVAFINGDGSRPRIVGVDSLGVNPVARLGDQVTMFLPPTMAVQGVAAGIPFVGTILIANPITGIISQGSGIVYTG
jgi:hypothetical protein